jgi:hypothetical protein
LAIIADGGRAIVVIYREGVEINYFLLYYIDSAKTLRRRPCPTPCKEAPGGGGMFVHKNHAAGEENGSIMVGMFVFLCLASQKPSEWEFFVPARTDLGVKLF